MELTVQEVATLLGRSPRAIRARITRGDLHAVKRDGQWRIPRHALPLTEGQRRQLQAKAGAIRQAVEEVLPSRMAMTVHDRRRSLADLNLFRTAAELRASLREADAARALAELEEGLLALAEGISQFDGRLKLEALNRARARFARATAVLMADALPTPEEPAYSWLVTLETELLPGVGALARNVERRRRG